ncbi:MAG: hypothetical protein ACQCN6_03495 [Candidatus Bathyarchaeia archaeon]
MKKDKPEPAHPDKNPWLLKPFRGIIRGDFQQSSLPHDVEVVIKNRMQLADYLNISKRQLLYLIYEDFPNGAPSKSKTLADAKVAEYEKTLCHQYLAKHYQNNITGKWSDAGKNVDAMGRNLYMIFGQRDPALFTLEDFRKAKADPRFYDARGKIKAHDLSHIKCIIKFAALQVKDSPLNRDHFQFIDGDEWYSAGLKNIGGKLDDYLSEDELKEYVKRINELDTLVLHRLGLEGFGRVSSQLMMGKKLPDGYTCQALWDINSISMFEPKVQEKAGGGKVKRRFTPETMKFFKRYLTDMDIKGAWFSRFPSEQHNYESFARSLKLAGLRAGIWRYKTAKKGEQLAEGEKLAPDGRVYQLTPYNNTKKGTVEYQKAWVWEGKMTTTHTVMKHTGVSLAGLKGWSLENCSQQSGTDTSTLKQFYHGTLGVDLEKAVMGERTYEPWRDWINRVIEPLYNERYNQLMKQLHGKAFDISAIALEEQAMPEVAE